jgi:hypothetical protein
VPGKQAGQLHRHGQPRPQPTRPREPAGLQGLAGQLTKCIRAPLGGAASVVRAARPAGPS